MSPGLVCGAQGQEEQPREQLLRWGVVGGSGYSGILPQGIGCCVTLRATLGCVKVSAMPWRSPGGREVK